MSDFSVRETVPGHKGLSDEELAKLNPLLPRLYHQIDLMIFATEGLKHNEQGLDAKGFTGIYGPIGDTLDKVIGNIDNGVHGHADKALKTKRAWAEEHLLRKMRRAVQEIDDAIAAGKAPKELVEAEEQQADLRRPIERFKLRTLLESKIPETKDGDKPSKVRQVVDLWIELDDYVPDYLCMPWVAIQAESYQEPVPRSQLDRHIKDMGWVTLEDLFTLSKVKNPELYEYVKRDKALGILSRPRAGRMQLMDEPADGAKSTNGTNNKVCENNNCVSGDSFCSEDSQGNCTVAG